MIVGEGEMLYLAALLGPEEVQGIKLDLSLIGQIDERLFVNCAKLLVFLENVGSELLK